MRNVALAPLSANDHEKRRFDFTSNRSEATPAKPERSIYDEVRGRSKNHEKRRFTP